MTFDPVKALVAYHAALNAHDIGHIETLLATNAAYSSAGLGRLDGRDAVVLAMRKYFDAHRDHHAWDDAVTATGPLQAHAVWQLTAMNNTTKEKSHRRGEETVTFDGEGKVTNVEVIDHP
jgi:SnoaL-like domain